MKSFKIYLQEESEKPMRLGDFVEVGTNVKDPHFYIVRRGAAHEVGKPTKEPNPEHFGVRVIKTDSLDPNYAYHMMQHIANTGHYKQFATGSTKLVNIRANHITDIPLGIRQ